MPVPATSSSAPPRGFGDDAIMSLTAKLVAGAVCLLGLAQARAAPPAAKLPADGSWVGYHVNRERADGSKSTLKVTISFVGRKVEDEVACRWIEFQEVDDRGKIQLIQKCLVPEQRLRKDPNPLRHVLRYWERDVTGKVRHFAKHVEDVLFFLPEGARHFLGAVAAVPTGNEGQGEAAGEVQGVGIPGREAEDCSRSHRSLRNQVEAEDG